MSKFIMKLALIKTDDIDIQSWLLNVSKLPLIPKIKPRINILGKIVRKNDDRLSPSSVEIALGETPATKKIMIPSSRE